jgi:hypothetical protein
MRRPTPLSEQLADWKHMIATNTRQHDEWPRCGWFKQRLEPRSKTWLPARVWLHQVIDWQTGELLEPEQFRLQIAHRTWSDQDKIQYRFMSLHPVTLDEYRWLTARLALHGMQAGPFAGAS